VSDGGLAISEEALGLVVERFYARVRLDPLLGPIFGAAVHDWPEHLARLTDFWSSVMLTSGRYKGRPLPAHLKHADAITPEGFGAGWHCGGPPPAKSWRRKPPPRSRPRPPASPRAWRWA